MLFLPTRICGLLAKHHSNAELSRILKFTPETDTLKIPTDGQSPEHARANVEPWYPYQLRHLNLTEIRDAFGVEHAQALGGHSRIDMTEVYAKQSERRAIEAARHAPKL